MAGHSKWANIRFRKGLQDAKRGKIFTKLIREITVAARMGGADETNNPRLRDAINKALKANMKRSTVNDAIQRGAGSSQADIMHEVRYEGYGPGGVAVLVDCLTDNKNRTVSEVRHAFTKSNGNLGTDGSVSYLFEKQGDILLAPTDKVDEAMEIAIDNGAEDVMLEDNQLEVITKPDTYHSVMQALREKDFEIENSELSMNANIKVTLDNETREKLERLIDMLEDLDDVQNVFTNAEFAE